MTNKCMICEAPAQLFSCRSCTEKLRGNLHRLAHGPTVKGRPTQGLLADLADVILKRTRISTSGGHRKRGDELPAPFEPDTAQGCQTAQGRADTLLITAQNTLSTTIRDLCEHRHLESPGLLSMARMSDWLAGNVHAIACGEDAKIVHIELNTLVANIERAVDRPVRRSWLIDCPTWDEVTQKACGVPLFATEDDIEVYCRTCRTTHSCARMKLLRQNDLERERLTWDRLIKANNLQEVGFRVPMRTLRKWRQDGSLRPRGWLRPDGGHGIAKHTDDDEPLYLWSDVKKLRERKPQKATTGGAAHRRATT